MAENSEKTIKEKTSPPGRVLSGTSSTGGPPLHIPLASPVRPELEEGTFTLSPTSSKAAKPPVGNLRHVSVGLACDACWGSSVYGRASCDVP